MKKKPILSALLTLAGFVILAILLDVLLPVAGRDRILLWGGLLLIGIISAVLIYLYLSPKGATPEQKASDIDLMLEAARKRLAASGIKGASIARMPVALLIGPTGSAKTSLALQSADGPELLAGEGSRGETPRPTESVNVWFSEGAVLVEAGGQVPADGSRWGKLLRKLRPSRFAAALGRGGQAPRVAVVCFSCEDLLRPGASQTVAAAAKALRESLAEVSRAFGVRLPVYVVFTKADRIAHFEEFVRHLSPAEAQQILGATLPLMEIAPSGYADAQAARVRSAFDGIFNSLAHWRLEVLPREGVEVARTGAYEFPRELTKVRELAASFLIELCRPSHLGINPFLRGFYFTGVRPIQIADVVAPKPAEPARQPGESLGATAVFGIPSVGTPAQPAPGAGGLRRIPDWVFLRRLLPDIVLADKRAQALTAGGARVDLLRRALITVGMLLLLTTSIGMGISYANNRTLLAEGRRGLESVQSLAEPIGEAPSLTSLVRLDSLRAVVDRMSEHERSGRPLRLRWGLYSGDDARIPLRQVYFDRFDELIWRTDREDLLRTLQTLPVDARATEDYRQVYGALKAYLVTTSYPNESSADFLTPSLLGSWRYGAELEPERRELVSRQLDFFARELPLGNPFPAEPSEPLVVQVRSFLQGFTVLEPFYEALVAEASLGAEPVRFTADVPGSNGLVVSTYTVPAAYTAQGWDRVQAILGDLDGLLAREDWVLGERAAIDPDEHARLAAELRTRYLRDYTGAWRDFLAGASVSSFSGPADAAGKLAVLASNRSPLLQILALVSRHTAVDTTVMRSVFQPVYTVIPAGENERLVTESNAKYMSALVELQSAMTAMADASGPTRDIALAGATGSVENVSMQAQELAATFNIEGDAGVVGAAVQRLLESPVVAARGLVRSLPTASVNASGASFCAPFTALQRKYPFDERAAQEATMEEISAALQPGGSALWGFYEETLRDLLVPQGNRYAPRVGASPQPTAEFTAFFNRAATISRALFPDGADSPTLRFALTIQTSEALPEVRVSMDGQTQTFTRTNVAARTFTWEGTRARTFRVTGVVNGIETTLLEGNEGAWTLFRILRLAEWEPAGTDRYFLRWSLPVEPQTLAATITFPSGTGILAPGQLRLGCTSQVVR